MSGARGRGERLSEATKIITSDRVLEIGEANETIRWSLGPPEGSGRTQEQLAFLASIPCRRRAQDRRRNEIGVQTLETSEGARRWKRDVDQPKRNDKHAWRVSVGTAS